MKKYVTRLFHFYIVCIMTILLAILSVANQLSLLVVPFFVIIDNSLDFQVPAELKPRDISQS